MKIWYFSSNRKSGIEALKQLIENNHEILICVFEDCGNPLIKQFCESNHIRTTNYSGLENIVKNNEVQICDYAISFLYRKIIKPDMLKLFKGNIINFHPSLVQFHKGLSACCFCILNDYKKWGVTAHYITEEIDEGDIIMQREFDVPKDCYGIELGYIEETELLLLFKDVIRLLENGIDLPRVKQNNTGKYYSQKDLDKDKVIMLNDSSEIIDKKIRALWYPPYHGAHIVIDGKKYSLVNDELLYLLAKENKEPN